MTTLFSHFLAQALGCASLDNVHNVVRTRLLFTPDHDLTRDAVDDFIRNGTEDAARLAFWAGVLALDPELLRDAAAVARRAGTAQSRKLPDLQLTWLGTSANLDPARPVRVRIELDLEAHPLRERLERLGPGLLQRTTGYTVADLNRPDAFDRILALANSHWQQLEQLTGLPSEAIRIGLEPVVQPAGAGD